MLKVAAYQGPIVQENLAHQLERTIELAFQAEREGIDILALPEAFLTGYYESKEEAERFSLTLEELTPLSKATANCSTTIIVGFNERHSIGMYNAVAVLESGQCLGAQRKHNLYHPYFCSSNTFSTFEKQGLTFGVIICLDSMSIEPARLLAMQGASVLFCPMFNRVPVDHTLASQPSQYSHFIARSFENDCHLVSADIVWPNDSSSVSCGHATIHSPDGIELARAKPFQEELLTVEIEVGRHRRKRRYLPSPELFNLMR